MLEGITSEQVEHVVKEHRVVMLKATASWCGPCRTLTPILAEVQEQFKDQGLKIVEIDVDQNMEFSAENAVTGVPSVFVYSEGKRVVFDDGNGNRSDRLIGVMPPEIYQGIAKDLLAQASA